MIFDRSWYNRLGVEYVRGFCSKEQHHRFLQLCPEMENYLDKKVPREKVKLPKRSMKGPVK